MDNQFDQFDIKTESSGNAFDQFDINESSGFEINPREALDFIKGLGQIGSRMAADIPVKVASGAAGLSQVVGGEGLEGAELVKKLRKETMPEIGEEGMAIAEDISSGIKAVAEMPGIDKIIEGSKSAADLLTKIAGATRSFITDPLLTAQSLAGKGEIPNTKGAAVGSAIGEAIPETALDAAGLAMPLRAGISRIKTPKTIASTASESTKLTKQIMSEAAPSISRLKDATREIYSKVDDLGVTVKQDAFQKFANQTLKTLERKGLDPDISPKAYAAINRMIKESQAGGVSVSKIDTLRQVAKNAANTIEGTDKALGSMMVGRIDDFLEGLDPKKVIGGQPKEVGQLLKNARDLWGRAKKSELIEDAIERASNQASGFENGLRTQFRSLLNNKKKIKGFTAQEKALIKQVENGTRMANLARLGGKFGLDLKQNTNALGAALGAGAGGVYGGGVGAVVVPVIGSVSRRLAEKLTVSNVRLAQDLVKAGKNGNEIVKAYMKNTPKESRSVAELTELLIRPGINAGKIKSSSEIVQDASYFANNFTPEQILAALGVASPPIKEMVDQSNQE